MVYGAFAPNWYTKFHPNPSTDGGVMMSYQSFKMAGIASSPPWYRVLIHARIMAAVSDYSCNFPWFNYFSNQIAKFSNQIRNRIAMFYIKSLHLKSNHQNFQISI